MRITEENIFKELDKGRYLEVLKSDLVDKVKDRHGWTPLHLLARCGVKEILNHPSVNKVKDNFGYTPLHDLAHWNYLTKEDLRKKYPWYNKKITNIYKAIDRSIEK